MPSLSSRYGRAARPRGLILDASRKGREPAARNAGGFFALAVVLIACGQALAGPPRPASDEEVKAMIAAAGDSKDHGGADLVYILDEADVYVRSSGVATTQSRQVMKLLTEKGVKEHSVQRLEFDPATNRLDVQAARIHRADGTIEAVAISTVTTQPAPQWSIYWGNRQHLLALPALQVGDSVELQLSRTGYNIAYLADAGTSAAEHRAAALASGDVEGLTPPMPGHWFEVTLFQSQVPILNKRYSVHMPKDMPVQYEVYNGPLRNSLWFDGDYHVYTWTAEKIPAVKREPSMVALDDAVPKVVMATVPDWEMKSRWFFEANEGQFAADEDIRKKVREITEGLESDLDKIAALQNWVADNVRYYGTSRGPCEGFTIHRSEETFRDRGGVCKDKAGMLVTMLREAGFEAYAALTMAGSRVEAIPADQFNHTVTVLRKKDGTFMILDPTWVPLSRELWSSREAEQHLVYGTPEGQPLTQSPYYEPEYNRLVARAESTLLENGELSTQITMDLHGYPCTTLRRMIDRHPPDRQRGAFERALNVAPNARMIRFEHTDPYDYSRDAQVEMTVSAEGYAAGGNGNHLFRLPLLSHPLGEWLIPDVTQSLEKPERTYGMRMRATRLVRYEETVKLPREWNVVRHPGPVKLDGPAISVSFEATPAEGEVRYRLEVALKKHIVAADEYPAVRDALKALRTLSEEWLVCTAPDKQGELTARAGAPAAKDEVRHE